MRLHPEVVKLFEEKRAEQSHYVRTAEITKNVRTVRDNAIEVFEKLQQRGVGLEKCEEQARLLEDSSQQFVREITSKNRCCKWSCWWCPSFCAE